MCFLSREGWRAACWPITAARGDTLSPSATGSAVLMGSGRSWDWPMADRCHGPHAKVMFWSFLSKHRSVLSSFPSFPHPPLLILHPPLCPSISRSQMCCVRLSSSWIMVTSGPGNSGSVLGWRRASPARKGSPCTGQPRGTAPSLGTGQEPLPSVTTMVRTDNITNLTHDKSCVWLNDVLAIFFPLTSVQ